MARRFSALLLAAFTLVVVGGCAATQRAWDSTTRTVGGWFSSNSVSADGVEAAELPTLFIVRSNVTARFGPDTRARSAGALQKGDRVARLEVQANWVRVWIPESGRVAWVSRDAVQPDGGGNHVRGTVPFNALLPFRVIATLANLRESPDPKADVVAELRHGTELRFLDARGGWVKVADPARRKMGWIASGAVGRSY
jgi:SH3-like domain-containing protein